MGRDTKVCIDCLGHMTEITATPKDGSPPEPEVL